MLPFRCAACGRPSPQAALCPSCGSRTFTLDPDAVERDVVGAKPPPPVPIEQARRRRRRRTAT